MSFKQSAITILKKYDKENKGIHSKEITRLALEENLIETNGKHPEQTMNAHLIVDINSKKKDSLFIKTGPGIFALNLGNLKKEELKKQEDIVDIKENKQEEKEKIESGFTGKGGEHLVCSKLLFLGLNASIMSVDIGVDIIAEKDNNFIGVQVKTSNLNKFNTYVFTIRRKSFETHNNNNIYYIFVLHGERQDKFVIIPFSEMEKQLTEGNILKVNQNKHYVVSIKIRDNKIYLGNLNNCIDYFVDNWKIIK